MIRVEFLDSDNRVCLFLTEEHIKHLLTSYVKSLISICIIML